MGILSMEPLLGLPGNVVITGCDSMRALDQAIRTATGFEPLTKEQIAALLERTRAGRHPEWLRSASM